VVGVDAALPAEPVPGELGVDTVDHLAEAVVTVRLEQWVDIASIGGPRLLDVLRARRRVGLVPHGEVDVDDRRDVAHGAPPG
jgi:hypothetical protein